MKDLLKQIYDKVIQGKDIKIRTSIKVNEIIKEDINQSIIVFLTMNIKNRALVVRGEGETLEESIENAITIYMNEFSNEFSPNAVKLDIVYDLKKENDKFGINQDKLKYKRGIEGISFDENLETAFLPQEITAYNLIKKRKINKVNSLKAKSHHPKNASLKFADILDRTKKVELYKFKTKAYYYDNDTFAELYRGHQIFRDINKEDLWNAIELSKNNYFKNVVNKKGKFIYIYQPHNNVKEKKYNILRHAGTTYSMLETYELMPDKEVLNLADKALEFLINKQETVYVKKKPYNVVVERDYYKLGGNALAIVAMAKYTQITGDYKYLENMQSMAGWMKETQDKKGRFTAHKQCFSTGKIEDFTSHYYPGETILALVRLYQVDKNEKWLDVAERAAKYLIQIRDKSATIDTIAHDHWLLYALNDLYRERKNKIYLKHSLFIAEAIMKTQIKEGEARAELVGGYTPKSGNEPKSTPVACRSEGLSATYKLAKDNNYLEEAKRMKQAINDGIQFQMQMQLRPESAMYYYNKGLCLGAVHSGLVGFEIRNDYTQHNISSFIAYYNILNNS